MDIKVRDLRQTDIIENENKLMVLVDDTTNLVKNITKEEFLTNVISSTENNALVQETDGNLYVNTSDIADNLAALSDEVDTIETNIGNLADLTTEDKTNLVAAINEAAESGGGGGSGYEVGDIVWRPLPTKDSGKHLLDGALLQYGIYKEFIDYIAELYGDGTNIPSYFCTESEWQTSVNTYGVCGKFVYDSVNNTVRLPKYSNKIYTQDIEQNDVPVVGNGNALGLNVTGATVQNFYARTGGTDAFLMNGTSNSVPVSGASGTTVGGYTNRFVGVSTDPTKSGLIAQLSDITTSLEGYYYIVVATSTKTDIQVDIDQIATDISGKADTDLTNITDTGYIKMAGAGMPGNKYKSLTLGASGSTYTAPADGYFYLNKLAGNPGFNPYIAMYNTSTHLGMEIRPGGNGGISIQVYVPAKKDAIVRVDYDATGTTNYFRFVYAVGSESEAN